MLNLFFYIHKKTGPADKRDLTTKSDNLKAYFESSVHVKFQWSIIKDKETTRRIVCQVWERHCKTSWSIMTSFNVARFY